MNKFAPKKKEAPVEDNIRTLWAAYYKDPVKVAEFKAQITAHTGLKEFKNLGLRFLSDNTAAIVYAEDDEPVAMVSVDWADICLRIAYVKW